MGHRCSLAIREGGRVELFYGHWSALQLPDQLFWGPEFVESFIRQHEEVDWWLDDVTAEGCVALDKDQKLILVHDGASVLSYGPESDYFFELMTALWADSGWTVQRVEHMETIAVHLGFGPEAVLWVPLPEEPSDLDEITDSWEPDSQIYTLISTPDHHLGTDALCLPLLANGPRVLDHLHRFPSLQKVLDISDHFDPIWIEGFLYFDPNTNELNIHSGDRYFVRHIPHVREAWPGWKVRFAEGTGVEHFRALGLEAPSQLVPVPHTRVVDWDAVKEDVLARLASEPENPIQWFLGLVSKLEITPTLSATQGPPDGMLTQDERLRLIERALRLKG